MSRSRNAIVAGLTCLFLVVQSMLRGPNVCEHNMRFLQYKLTTSKRKGKNRRKIVSFFIIRRFKVCCSGFVKIDNVCFPALTSTYSTRMTSSLITSTSVMTSIGQTGMTMPMTSSVAAVNATPAMTTDPTDSSNYVLQITLPVVLALLCVAVIVLGIVLKKQIQKKSKRLHHYEQCKATPISQGHTYYGLEAREYAEISDVSPETGSIAEYADVTDFKNVNSHYERYANSGVSCDLKVSDGQTEPISNLSLRPK